MRRPPFLYFVFVSLLIFAHKGNADLAAPYVCGTWQQKEIKIEGAAKSAYAFIPFENSNMALPAEDLSSSCEGGGVIVRDGEELICKEVICGRYLSEGIVLERERFSIVAGLAKNSASNKFINIPHWVWSHVCTTHAYTEDPGVAQHTCLPEHTSTLRACRTSVWSDQGGHRLALVEWDSGTWTATTHCIDGATRSCTFRNTGGSGHDAQASLFGVQCCGTAFSCSMSASEQPAGLHGISVHSPGPNSELLYQGQCTFSQ